MQLEDDVVPCESQMENWKTNLEVMAVKEEQYIQQYKKYEVESFFFQFLHSHLVIGKLRIRYISAIRSGVGYLRIIYFYVKNWNKLLAS